MIDRKFKLFAVNPCNGKTYTEEDAVVFVAKDMAFPAALKAYVHECVRIGCEKEHIQSVTMLLDRVLEYQENNKDKVKAPDTNLPGEIERCIEGKNLDRTIGGYLGDKQG